MTAKTLARDFKSGRSIFLLPFHIRISEYIEAVFMKLTELKSRLNEHPDANVRFLLPNGDSVPAHAHVTEVARIDKRFADCGGTLRNDSLCRLQTWFSDDVDHRLTAGKLVKILEKAKSFLVSDDLEVDVEHEVGVISQFPLESIEVAPSELILHLTERHTACLAMDKCKPPTPSDFNPLKFNFGEKQTSSGCCAEE
jgi:hypothetical protein